MTATAVGRGRRLRSVPVFLVLMLVLVAAGPAAAQDDATVGVSTDLPGSFPTAPPATAQAYLLVDADTGQPLAARAADDLRVVASTVKILTVLAALQVLDLDQTVTVGDEVTIGGAGVGLAPGERWTVQQLVDAVIVRSGNDAARALAVAADGDIPTFMQRMRDLAVDLGLDDAVLDEPTGLDDTNRLSARHLATAAREALDEPAVQRAAAKPEVVLPGVGSAETRNLLIGTYPGATGLKTGYTDAAGYCLVASAIRDDAELVAVILGSRDEQSRFDEAAALLDHGFERFVALDTGAWRVRRAGGWDHWVSGTPRVWLPVGAPTSVRLTPPVRWTDDLSARFAAAGEVVADLRASPPTGQAAPVGVGAHLVETVYAGLRQGHRIGAWERGGGAAAASGDLG